MWWGLCLLHALGGGSGIPRLVGDLADGDEGHVGGVLGGTIDGVDSMEMPGDVGGVGRVGGVVEGHQENGAAAVVKKSPARKTSGCPVSAWQAFPWEKERRGGEGRNTRQCRAAGGFGLWMMDEHQKCSNGTGDNLEHSVFADEMGCGFLCAVRAMGVRGGGCRDLT